MPNSAESLQRTDPELYQLVLAEAQRQHDTIRLIPSENYVSSAVLAATGTVLTNKYSEGYPGRRYYEGSSSSTKSSGSPVTAPKRYLALKRRMFNPTLARPPTWRFILPSVSRAIRSWDWGCRMAVTSPTAGR